MKSSLPLEKQAVTSSIFKSDSVRELAMVKRGPGPALYKPESAENQRILNFNPAKKFI
jgi:hypothetical protein